MKVPGSRLLDVVLGILKPSRMTFSFTLQAPLVDLLCLAICPVYLLLQVWRQSYHVLLERQASGCAHALRASLDSLLAHLQD